MTATPDDRPAEESMHLEIGYPAGLETADLRTAINRAALRARGASLSRDLVEHTECTTYDPATGVETRVVTEKYAPAAPHARDEHGRRRSV